MVNHQIDMAFYHRNENALLIGTQVPGQPRWDCEDLMGELVRLAETAGAIAKETMIQGIRSPDPAFYIGSGKVTEIADICEELEIDIVIFNNNLSPAQQKNLEMKLKKKIVDRTGLILDIFAQRALTKEGKMQVELAQLKYLLPRLTRMWTHLSRLGGGIGTRGPGETQLESDRRRINARITKIERQLKAVSKHRLQHRLSRKSVPFPVVALIGYTNSGKSTLFEQLTGEKTFIEDKLFATLDPLIRKVTLDSGLIFLLLDTVGFIRELPTQLVAAFKATLEEIQSANLLLHVIDISNPMADEHIRTVDKLVDEMEICKTPQIRIYNKIDALTAETEYLVEEHREQNSIFISALQQKGLDTLREAIIEKLSSFRTKLELDIPYHNQGAIKFAHKFGTIISIKYEDDIVHMSLEMDHGKAEKLKSLMLDRIARIE